MYYLLIRECQLMIFVVQSANTLSVQKHLKYINHNIKTAMYTLGYY